MAMTYDRVARATVGPPDAGRRSAMLLGATVAVGLLVTGGARLAGAAGQHVARLTGPGPADPATVLAWSATAGCAAVALWLALTVTVAVAATLHPRAGALTRVAAKLAPATVRQVVAMLLGAAVATTAVAATAAAAPAVAASTGATTGPVAPVTTPGPTTAPGGTAPGGTASGAAALLDPGWVPGPPPRAAVTPPGGTLLVPAPRVSTAAETDTVVVRRGDTLWDLAARALPPTATDGEIAVEWPRWYRANREVVGEDPDLLLPGQRLVVPGPGPGHGVGATR